MLISSSCVKFPDFVVLSILCVFSERDSMDSLYPIIVLPSVAFWIGYPLKIFLAFYSAMCLHPIFVLAPCPISPLVFLLNFPLRVCLPDWVLLVSDSCATLLNPDSWVPQIADSIVLIHSTSRMSPANSSIRIVLCPTLCLLFLHLILLLRSLS